MRDERRLLNLYDLLSDRLGKIDALAHRIFPGKRAVALQVEHLSARVIADSRRETLAVSDNAKATIRGVARCCGHIGNICEAANGGKLMPATPRQDASCSR